MPLQTSEKGIRYWGLQRFVSVLLLIFSALYLAASFFMPLGSIGRPGPGFVPTCIGIFLGFLVVLYFINVFRKRYTHQKENFFGQKEDSLRVARVVFFLFFYGIFLGILGYILSTLITVIAVLYLLRMRGWVRIILISILVSAGSYYFFTGILEVPLPHGILPF